jgi:hypothetical protein
LTIIPVKTSAAGFFLVGDGGLHYLGRSLDHGAFAPCGHEYCVLAQGHASGRGPLDHAVAVAQGVCTHTGEPAVVAKLVGWNASPDAPQIAVQAVYAVRPTQREALIEAAYEAAGRALTALGVPVEKADDPLSTRGFDRIVDKLSARIRRDALAATREPITRLLDQTDKRWRQATDKQLEIMFRQIERAMKASGVKAPPGVVTRLRTEGDRVVKATRRRTVKKFELEVSAQTSQKDLRAIRRVARDQGNFVTDFYTKTLDENLSRVARETVERGVADGLDNRVISRDLKAAMGGQLAGRTTAYYDVVANSFVNRARSYSSLRTFQDAEVENYIISAVLDEVTTDTCRSLSGKRLQVSRGLDLFNEVQDLANPQDIKTTQPWFAERAIKGGPDEGKTGLFLPQKAGPAQLMGVIERSGVGRRDDVGQFSWRVGDKALQGAGVGFPPYHGRCRTNIVPDI